MSDATRPAVPSPGIFDLLEPEFTEQGPGRVRLVFPMKTELTIPPGILQGGIVTAMLDMAMAFAAGGAISTASIQVDILRPAAGASFVVVGRVEKQGRRLMFLDAEMRDENGTLLARGRQTAVPPSSQAQ